MANVYLDRPWLFWLRIQRSDFASLARCFELMLNFQHSNDTYYILSHVCISLHFR